MRFWIGIHLPQLPLETFRPCWSEFSVTKPGIYAVLEHDRVVAMSDSAAQQGVHIGMRRGGVSAMAPDAILYERDAQKEQAALDSVALALLQYTPEVAFADHDSMLLDVTASLRAFDGRLALCRRIRATVAALGFSVQLGTAPTAQGAWLLACHVPARSQSRRTLRRTIKLTSLQRRLDILPCALLPQVQAHQDWLHGIGCRRLADLRKLPRAGLQRRSHKDLLNALDRAYGLAPELFTWVQAPQTFCARLELPDRIEYAEAVLFAARRLILQMVGWLVSLQQAVAHIILSLEHERGRSAIAPTVIDIALAEPTWREEHLIRLLKERLARIELDAPVIALRLDAPRTVPMLPPTESLFPEPGGTAADYNRLLELLIARLGSDRVLAPAPRADHRPELCNAWLPATDVKAAPPPAPPFIARPFWLLEKPIALLLRDHRPFYGSPLRLISGPERIEAGWWDGPPAVRDYFVAQGAESACYWVYRERAQQQARWFLHGLFA